MAKKIIVYLLSLSILIMAGQTVAATQNLGSSLAENNTTLMKTIQNDTNLNPIEKKQSYQMELLGPWTVEFNTSEELYAEKLHLDPSEGFAGIEMEGFDIWGLSLIDSMDHEVGALMIIDSPRATVVNEETLDDLIDSVLDEFDVVMPAKTAMEIDGTSGRQGVGYSPMYKRDIRSAAYPFQPYYDSFYSQNVSKSLIYYMDLNNENEFSEVISSLHVERLSEE